MSSDVPCRVLLKQFNEIKNQTLSDIAPDFEYKCTVYQYCCYNYTVPHSPWCCDASYTVIYKDWYLWVILSLILSLITILICALFFYFRFFQKRQLERRIIRATLELETHYRPLGQDHQVVFGTSHREEDDDKSWTTEDPPPCYSDIISQPPSYSSNKNIATAGATPALPTQDCSPSRRQLPHIRDSSTASCSGS